MQISNATAPWKNPQESIVGCLIRMKSLDSNLFQTKYKLYHFAKLHKESSRFRNNPQQALS